MSPLFENRYISNDKILKEYVNKVLCRNQMWSSIALSACLSIELFFVLFIPNYILSAVLGTFIFILVVTAILTPISYVRQLKENSNRIHNGKTYETVVSFGDNISISEGSFSLTVEYSQLQKIYPLKYSYVLMFGKRNGLILSPDHFTIGTFEDFKKFIEPKVNINTGKASG